MNPYLEKCLPYLRKPFVKVPFLHCHPYSWLNQKSEPVESRNGWARAHWYFNVGSIIVHCIFVAGRTVQVLLSPEASLAQRFYMGYVAPGFMLAALINVTTVTASNEFVPFFRRYISFVQDALILSRGAGASSQRKVKACHLFLASFYYTHWVLVVVLTAFNVARPTSPEFWSSLFVPTASTGMGVPISVILASSALQAYIMICVAQVWNLLGGILILFMFTMPDFLGIKRTMATTIGSALDGVYCHGADNPLVGVRSHLRHYVCLQLLTYGFDRVFAMFLGILHGMVMAFVVLCLVGSVRTGGAMAIVQAYVGLWSLLAYLQAMNSFAEINNRSEALLRSLRKNSTGHKGLKRQLRSFKELRVKGGSSAFYFDKKLVITVIGTVFIQSANLLILS